MALLHGTVIVVLIAVYNLRGLSANEHQRTNGRWCSYPVTKRVSCKERHGTETYMHSDWSTCQYAGGYTYPCRKHKLMQRPAYRTVYKFKTENMWRCCPGYYGDDCQHKNGVANTEPVKDTPHVSEPARGRTLIVTSEIGKHRTRPRTNTNPHPSPPSRRHRHVSQSNSRTHRQASQSNTRTNGQASHVSQRTNSQANQQNQRTNRRTPELRGPSIRSDSNSVVLSQGSKLIDDFNSKMTTLERKVDYFTRLSQQRRTHQQCQCPAGPAGPPGHPGPRGVPGPRGPVGREPSVDRITAEVRNAVLKQLRTDLPRMEQLRGPPGPPGPPGISIPTGVPRGGGRSSLSVRGPQGPRGRAGLPGVQGSPGEPGRPGERGKDGAPGPPGRDGDVGPPGPVGPMGESGRTDTHDLKREIKAIEFRILHEITTLKAKILELEQKLQRTNVGVTEEHPIDGDADGSGEIEPGFLL